MTDSTLSAAQVEKAKESFKSSPTEDLCMKLAIDFLLIKKDKFGDLDWKGSNLDSRIYANHFIVEVAHNRYDDCLKATKPVNSNISR